MSGEKASESAGAAGGSHSVDVPILGLLQTEDELRDYTNDTSEKLPKAGRLVVYGDSSCLEGGAARPCHWLLLAALQYALVGHVPTALREAAASTRHRDVHIIPSELPKRAEGGRLHAYSRILSADGSGPRPVPECVKPVPLEPSPVHAPPSERNLAPRHPPTDPKSIGAPDIEATDAAPRAWRGAGAAPARSRLDTEPAPSTFANKLLLLSGIILIVYSLTAFWKRCGRKIRRRRLISLAT